MTGVAGVKRTLEIMSVLWPPARGLAATQEVTGDPERGDTSPRHQELEREPVACGARGGDTKKRPKATALRFQTTYG